MVNFSANSHKAPTFDRIENDPVTGQSLLEQFDLELQEPNMGFATRRPRLMKQHQQCCQPSRER